MSYTQQLFAAFLITTTVLLLVQPSAATPKTYQYMDERRYRPETHYSGRPQNPQYDNREDVEWLHYNSKQSQYQPAGNRPNLDNREDAEETRYTSKQSQYQPAANRHNAAQQQKFAHLNQQSGHGTALTQSNAAAETEDERKCKIWVPADSVGKYPGHVKFNEDLANRLSHIQICCPGYWADRLKGDTICRPICENCRNGYCVAPGDCRCFDEFVRNDNGDCVFTCPLGCLNGRCFLDGTCLCNPGFTLDETRQFCRPICSSGCGLNARHNCTEPEVCGCTKGYQLTDAGCLPTCQPDCGAGGYCRELNVCECKPEFQLRDGVCQSDCYQKCANGVCYGRNRCICNSGFTYHERSRICIPV